MDRRRKKFTNTRDLSGQRTLSAGLHRLMKAFGNRQKYFGWRDEDLVGVIEVYELAPNMCDLSQDGMMKGLPALLDGQALSYLFSRVKNTSQTYDEAISALFSLFTSDKQRACLLPEWYNMWLTSWFLVSQPSVFRGIFAIKSKVHNQL